MRVLLLGSGAREHALAWKLHQSPLLSELLCAPGNPGTEAVAENVPVRADDVPAVVALALRGQVDLVVVGPEGPLVAGVADALRAAGVAVFGPVAAAARLEGSKAFAKELMASAGVPTAGYRVFDDLRQAQDVARRGGPVVVKADGLAAGKGVVVARSGEAAAAAVEELSALGPAAERLVFEELLEGEEVSVIALCDGERYALLPAARDHKRVGDGDTGPNTGGMGAFAPAPSLDAGALEEVGRTVIAPTLAELSHRGCPFHGALYAGLMLTAKGVRVLEFNCRLGDPETQPLMMMMDEDLLPLLDACARGRLDPRAVRVKQGAAVGIVLAAHGYPQKPLSGDEILGLDSVQGAEVFHAGTKREGARLFTSGGRVLTVCAAGPSLAQARASAYRALAPIRFEGAQFRHDIGGR